MSIRSFRDLIAWQKAMDLATCVYEATRGFPVEEKYGLVVQMRWAAVSIPSNIAEGQARATRGEFVQFLGNAFGSLAGLQTQALLCERLGFLNEPQVNTLADLLGEVGRLLTGLRKALRKN